MNNSLLFHHFENFLFYHSEIIHFPFSKLHEKDTLFGVSKFLPYRPLKFEIFINLINKSEWIKEINLEIFHCVWLICMVGKLSSRRTAFHLSFRIKSFRDNVDPNLFILTSPIQTPTFLSNFINFLELDIFKHIRTIILYFYQLQYFGVICTDVRRNCFVYIVYK